MTSIYTGFKLNGMHLVTTSKLVYVFSSFIPYLKTNWNYHDVAAIVKNDDQQWLRLYLRTSSY